VTSRKDTDRGRAAAGNPLRNGVPWCRHFTMHNDGMVAGYRTPPQLTVM